MLFVFWRTNFMTGKSRLLGLWIKIVTWWGDCLNRDSDDLTKDNWGDAAVLTPDGQRGEIQHWEGGRPCTGSDH